MCRCDGETIQKHIHPEAVGTPCTCPEGSEKPCEDVTRFSVFLPDLPGGLQFWRVDTQGYDAGTSILGQMLMLQGLTQPVEGYISIEKQKRKEYDPATQKYRTKNFSMLTLERIYTPRQVLYELPAAQERKQLAEHIDDLWGEETSTTAAASDSVEKTEDSEPEPQKNEKNLQQAPSTQKDQAMASLNKVILMGNLTRDPELRYTPNGTPVATMGLAVNRRYRQGDEWKDEVCYIDIVTFGRQAETVCEFLQKGRAALVEGRLQWRSWETEDGQRRTKHEVVAERVQFLPSSPAMRESGRDTADASDAPPYDADDEVPF